MSDYEDHVAKAHLALDAVEHTEDPHQLTYTENALLAIAHATLAAAAQQEVANRIALAVAVAFKHGGVPAARTIVADLVDEVFPEGAGR